MIKILLVDDHEILLEGIKGFFDQSEQYEIVATANNGFEAYQKLHNKNIDLLITDLNMPKASGIDLIRKTKLTYPNIKIIALTMYFESNLLSQLIELEINGYVNKNYSKERFMDAIEKVVNGNTYITPEIKKIISNDYLSLPEKKLDIRDQFVNQYLLTNRELEIYLLIVKNFKSNEIAKQLEISIETVSTHRKRIMKKTKSNSILDLYKMAIENQLID